MSQNQTVNLVTGNQGFRLKTQVAPGNRLLYHGSAIDPYACPLHVAERMAADPKCRYVEKVAQRPASTN